MWAILLLLASAAASPVLAGDALNCLSSSRVLDCLTDKAMVLAQREQSQALKAEAYETMLTTLAKIGVENKKVFEASSVVNTDGVPILARWQLEVARRAYATRFSIDENSLKSVAELDALVESIRERAQGFERFSIISTACEARELTPPDRMPQWDGLLDRQCYLHPADANAVDQELPGLSALSAPLINAYNRDKRRFADSLVISNSVLEQFQNLLHTKLSRDGKEAISGLVSIGYLMRASGFVLLDEHDEAKQAIQLAKKYLSRSQKAHVLPGIESIQAYLSWAMAKSGMSKAALLEVRAILRKVDSAPRLADGEKAVTLAICIETLSNLQGEK